MSESVMPAAKVSTVQFGKACEKFVSAGIHPRCLIPIAPPGARISERSDSLTPKVLGKAPGRYRARGDEWTGLTGDTLRKGLTADEIERAASWPTGNVGVLGRAYPAIDSDAESPEARMLVARFASSMFPSEDWCERVRGDNDRRLYAFRCRDPREPVKTRHVTWSIPNRDGTPGTPNKIDIIGNGGQYLIDGTHPDGDPYEWFDGAALFDREAHDCIALVDDSDFARFLTALEDEVLRLGGEWRGRVNGGTGDATDPMSLEPSWKLEDIRKALAKVPNNERNFPERDDLVSFLGALRAGMGRNCDDHDFQDEVREWATADAGWCDEDYFDKIWDSLHHTYAGPGTLGKQLKGLGYTDHEARAFEGGERDAAATIQAHKEQAKDARSTVLHSVAGRFMFRDADQAAGVSKPLIRDAFAPEGEILALDWYNFESTDRNAVITEANNEYGGGKKGFWNFFSALKAKHPEAMYHGTARNPFYGYGELVPTQNRDPEAPAQNMLNIWHLALPIKLAKRPSKDPARDGRDVKTFREFVERMFGGGEIAKYELDTLAYMAQTQRRPPALLFLVGESGVGKSTYAQFMTLLFNGYNEKQEGAVDGTKLVNNDSRRFALAQIEGCRIVTIREMPKGKGNARELSQITAQLKQWVDPGREGDTIRVERKGVDTESYRNFARFVITSNYDDAILIEADERRIFMVTSAIRSADRPPESYWAELNAIMDDPERMAGLMRWLKARDISGFKPNSAPPSTTSKREKQLAAIEQPAQRHFLGALEWLRASDRTAFDRNELAELADECARIEFENTGDDNRMDYAKQLSKGSPDPRITAAMRVLSRDTIKPETEMRSGTRRDPQVYFFKDHADTVRTLDTQGRRAIIEFVDREYERDVIEVHPWKVFQR